MWERFNSTCITFVLFCSKIRNKFNSIFSIYFNFRILNYSNRIVLFSDGHQKTEGGRFAPDYVMEGSCFSVQAWTLHDYWLGKTYNFGQGFYLYHFRESTQNGHCISEKSQDTMHGISSSLTSRHQSGHWQKLNTWDGVVGIRIWLQGRPTIHLLIR